MTEEEQTKLDQEHARLLVASEHWTWAKGKFLAYLTILDSISTIPKGLTSEEKLRMIEVRQEASAMLKTWLEEVEGSANQHQFNVTNKEQDELITRFE